MGKEYQFTTFMDYTRAFRNVTNDQKRNSSIKITDEDSRVVKYLSKSQNVLELKKDIMKKYQLNHSSFKVWYNANSEFLFGGVLTADEKQEILMLEAMYRKATEVDPTSGGMELSNLHKSLQDAGYTEFIESYIEDYTL